MIIVVIADRGQESGERSEKKSPVLDKAPIVFLSFDNESCSAWPGRYEVTPSFFLSRSFAFLRPSLCRTRHLARLKHRCSWVLN
jgi:hypothetical protein